MYKDKSKKSTSKALKNGTLNPYKYTALCIIGLTKI